MADSPVGSLPQATSINDADLFVLEQNGTAKKLSGAKLTEFIDRNILDVQVYPLSSTANPSSSFDRITGILRVGIPSGRSIDSAMVNSDGELVLTLTDGLIVNCGTVKGDRGLSAYDYAVEHGYTGSETDFATLQVQLYEASVNENQRVEAEANRQSNYVYMMNRVEQKLDEMDGIINQNDMVVVDTTLVLYRESLMIADTTLIL